MEVDNMKILKYFTEKADKEKIFDLFLYKMLGIEYRDEWVADDKEYVYGKDESNYWIEVNTKKGNILKRCYPDDRIGEAFNIQWICAFGQ